MNRWLSLRAGGLARSGLHAWIPARPGNLSVMSERVHASVTVNVEPDRAFDLFARGLAAWWPPEYSWSQDVLEDMGIEPHEGGICFEVGPHGFRCDWGRVLAWDRRGGC